MPPAPLDGEITPLPDPENIGPVVTGRMAAGAAWLDVAVVVAPTLDMEKPATCVVNGNRAIEGQNT